MCQSRIVLPTVVQTSTGYGSRHDAAGSAQSLWPMHDESIFAQRNVLQSAISVADGEAGGGECAAWPAVRYEDCWLRFEPGGFEALGFGDRERDGGR